MTKELVLLSLLTLAVVPNALAQQPEPPQDRLEQLRSLPYLASPDPKARTGLLGIHESEAMPGYNLFDNTYHNTAALMDNRGHIVHRWSSKDHSSWHAVEVSPAAELFVVHGWDGLRENEFPGQQGLASRLTKLAPDSSVIWSVELPVHHDIQILPGGNLLVLLEHFRKISRGMRTRRENPYRNPKLSFGPPKKNSSGRARR